MAKLNLKELDTEALKKLKRNNILTIIMGALLTVYFIGRYVRDPEVKSHYLVGGIVCGLVILIVAYRTVILARELKSRNT